MKETYTRAEVEALLEQLQKENEYHFEQERADKLPPVWATMVLLCILFGTLWVIAVLG